MGASRRYIRSAVVILALGACAVSGQDLATLCQILEYPGRHSGRMTILKVEIVEPRRVHIIDSNRPNCGRVPILYPDSREVRPRAPFQLVEDAKFKLLQDNLGLLLAPPPGSDRVPSRIFATVLGRFDSVYEERRGVQVRGNKRIGHMGGEEHVFVLKKVIEVLIQTPKPSAVHESEHVIKADPGKPK